MCLLIISYFGNEGVWKYHALLVRPGSNLIQDKLKISIYLSWDKYKKSKCNFIFN